MKLYIHIGMLKTGTTFIEDNLYSNHPQINFLNKVNFKDIEDINYCIQNLSDKEFEKKHFEINKKLNYLKFRKEKINIISSVGLSDVIVSNTNQYDLKKMLNRLQKVFKKKYNLKILFTIRDQKTYLLSRYSEAQNKFAQKNSKWKTFDGLLDYFYPKKKHLKIEKLFFESLKYNKQINIIEKIFKKRNCKILLYEHLNNNQKSFIKEVCNFLKINFTKKFENKFKIINKTKRFDERYVIKSPKIKKLIIKNILDPKFFLLNFFNKVLIGFNLLFNYITFNIFTSQQNRVISLTERDQIRINNYYKKDNILLRKKIKNFSSEYNYTLFL